MQVTKNIIPDIAKQKIEVNVNCLNSCINEKIIDIKKTSDIKIQTSIPDNKFALICIICVLIIISKTRPIIKNNQPAKS